VEAEKKEEEKNATGRKKKLSELGGECMKAQLTHEDLPTTKPFYYLATIE